MALGILEPGHTEHTPGTININEAAQRAEELLRHAPHLNLKTTKDGKKILVPQPSEDPKDPLVSITTQGMTCVYSHNTELATMETRYHSSSPLACLGHCNDCIAPTGCRLDNYCDSLLDDIRESGSADSVSSGRCGRRRCHLRTLRAGLGKEASVSLRSTSHGRELCVGWCN